MCGRYTLFALLGDIEERFGATFAHEFQPRYNAAPSQSLPVIADDAPESIAEMEWGFVPPWADDRRDFGFINARAETLTEKPSFREAVQQADREDLRVGRCLVPADGFYEWAETDNGKQPYRVTMADEGLFAMAGLWAEWQPKARQTGLDSVAGSGRGDNSAVVRTFSIVTTEPNELVGGLHRRMAAVLRESDERRWLDAPVEDIGDVLSPYPSDGMRVYPVSTVVNDPSNDSPSVIEPLEGSWAAEESKRPRLRK